MCAIARSVETEPAPTTADTIRNDRWCEEKGQWCGSGGGDEFEWRCGSNGQGPSLPTNCGLTRSCDDLERFDPLRRLASRLVRW